jgi:hypothetical protein
MAKFEIKIEFRETQGDSRRPFRQAFNCASRPKIARKRLGRSAFSHPKLRDPGFLYIFHTVYENIKTHLL